MFHPDRSTAAAHLLRAWEPAARNANYGDVTIADVVEFYVRRDVAEATGSEAPCTGCDKQLAPGDAYSHYDLAEKPRPRSFPTTILLCQKCTYQVIGYIPPLGPR
jgi:hypothetical protein